MECTNGDKSILLNRMQNGGLSSEERLRCFEDFQRTKPSLVELQKFYDLWGNDYDNDMIYDQSANKLSSDFGTFDVVQEVLKLYPNDKDIKILDIAAGTGTLGKLLNNAGFTSIDGTDASRVMLAQAEKCKVYQNLFHEQLVENKKFRDGYRDEYYDIVVSTGSFYPSHLTGNHLQSLISCVKPTGHFIISSSPGDDENVDMSAAIKQLQTDGIVSVVEEIYVPNYFRNIDGIVWVLKMNKF